ncbi:hypothetical protein ACFV0H_27715 [Streptomyces erythrochromogenes]|uniref:Uncharacterized protein n=1 Tax=Streptomyces erythrochromogenes TaxID=285574 RepID=A0ABZ1QP96_9ACTN|nr:hypothetical protein [Streptomyces erythrochromogenes]MCX5586084.1 hypothetical protein [Streptomyces erythrochromogenes]
MNSSTSTPPARTSSPPASAEDVIQNLSDNGPDKLLFTNGL